MLPGPHAVGQVLGVQNSDSALENRFMCLKNATAGGNKEEENDILSVFILWRCRVQLEDEEQEREEANTYNSADSNGVYSLLLASHSALSTPGGSAVRANMSVCVTRWHTYCCWRYGRSSRLLLLIPLGRTVQS